MATKSRLTAQDLRRLGEGDTRRELVNGEVIETAPVGGSVGRSLGRFTVGWRRMWSSTGEGRCWWAMWASCSDFPTIPSGCGLLTWPS